MKSSVDDDGQFELDAIGCSEPVETGESICNMLRTTETGDRPRCRVDGAASVRASAVSQIAFFQSPGGTLSRSSVDACKSLLPFSEYKVAQLWQRPRDLGDFKGVGHFDAKF